MEKLYTTLDHVEMAVRHHYHTYGVKISFVNALEFLIGAGRVSKRKPRFPAFYDFMNDDEFRDYMLHMPIDILKVLGNNGSNFTITEERLFPDDKDVFALKHVPLINNGIHQHDHFEINYMYSGTCIQHFEKEQRQLAEGDICIIPPFAPHDIVTNMDSLVISIAVRKSTFDKVFWNLLTHKDLLSMFFSYSLYEKESNPNYLILHTDNNTTIKFIIQNIIMESNSTDSYANNCCVSLLNVLLGKILRDYGSTMRMYNEESMLRRKFDFSLLLQYIQHNYQTVTLQSLAALFHYSETYLSKLIKDNMGKSFIEIIQSFKMKRASETLLNTNMKIHEIAEFVGYDSVDHFSRTFKKTFGVSPVKYRKTNGSK